MPCRPIYEVRKYRRGLREPLSDGLRRAIEAEFILLFPLCSAIELLV